MIESHTTRRSTIAGLVLSFVSLFRGSTASAAQTGTTGTIQPLGDEPSPSAVPVTHWHDEAVHGSNLRPALLAAIQAIKDGKVQGRYLMVPPRAEGWTVSAEVLFDVSNLKIDFYGNIRQTATMVQHTLRFSSEPNPSTLPATYLDDIALRFAESVVIDGNADEMAFPEPTPGTTPDWATLQCDHVTRLRVYGGHFTNGPMNSASFRRCPRHVMVRAEFSNSLWDNGFTASTDLASYDPSRPETWGGGTLIECTAHNNKDVGMTAFNVSGQRFARCTSYDNDAGYSYEHAYLAMSGEKDYHGIFEGCIAYDNITAGFYVDGSGVTVDDASESWGTVGRGTADPLDIYGHGVIVAGVMRSYVGGRHHNNARCGVYFSNANSINSEIVLAADCSDNAWHGARVQRLASLRVLGKARFTGNGTDHTAHSGAYGHGLYCSSDGLMDGKGDVIIDPSAEFSRNASRAIRISNYARAFVRGAWGSDNFCFAGAGPSAAIMLDNLTDAVVENCHLDCANLRQTQVVSIGERVANGIESGTRGNGTLGLVLNAAASKR